MKDRPTRVLFFAEGATLAHVGRPFVLASTLSREDSFEVVLARPPAYAWLTAGATFRVIDLACQAPAIFARRLDRGQPLYTLPTLESYVQADRALIRDIRPDVVVGDFRLSLSVSARLEGIPYATICDAYWSPEAAREAPPLPALPFTRFLPIAAAERLFSWVSPLAFRLHSRPMEQLRRSHGLPGLGHDLRRAYTDADLRLFASFPGLFPEVRPNKGAAFIGAVDWAPDIALPEGFPQEEGLVYVTMGSSGRIEVLEPLFEALRELDLPAVVATAGRKLPIQPHSSRIRVFDFLPGDKVVARARIVICNGGSPTTNQALLGGVPVVGIPANMDQMLNMRAVERAGLGLGVRADRASRAALLTALRTALAFDSAPGERSRWSASLAHCVDLPAGPNHFSALIARLATPDSCIAAA